jgi:hypothetical protein
MPPFRLRLALVDGTRKDLVGSEGDLLRFREVLRDAMEHGRTGYVNYLGRGHAVTIRVDDVRCVGNLEPMARRGRPTDRTEPTGESS